MQDSLIIYEKNKALISAGFLNGRMQILNIDETSNPYSVGNIYVGHVSKVVLHLNAAYIDIGMQKLCYMELTNKYISDKLHPDAKLHVGDNIIVQILKDSNGSKPVTVSPVLSITGRYSVVSYDFKNDCGISSKIKDGELRKSLKNALSEYIDEKISVIARTSCEASNIDAVIAEINKSKELLENIVSNGQTRNKGTLLYQSEPGYLSNIRDLLKINFDKIITDSPEIFIQLKEYIKANNFDNVTLDFYSDKVLPLENLYDMRKNLSELVRERVWLKSGAHIVIQKTEALYTIDVNSSKSSDNKKNFKEGFMDINLEAAKEIYRQIKLRNISGIIIIDFINMKGCDSVIFLNQLKDLYKEDKTIQVVDITKLGLVELTRLRRKQPITDLITKYSLDT